MRLQLITISTLLLISSSLFAQKTWTLRECIDYARTENIQVKKQQLSSESYDIDLKQSKAELFPSLSGSISQGYNHSSTQNDFRGQYGLNLNWTIFNGGKNLNSIKQANLNKQAEDLNTEYQQNSIEISIAQTYLQLLYARESIKNNENIVESSTQQLKQTKDFFNAGSITRAEYAQVEAQYSSDKYNLSLAQNSYDSYKLQLKQLLELDITDEFEVEFPEISNDDIQTLIPSKSEIYRTALLLMPEIKSSKLSIDMAELDKATAKGGYLPTVSLSGSLGTGNVWDTNPSFLNQLDKNFNQYIGVSVSIPIFDNRKNKSTVQKAEIQRQTAELNYLDAQKTLLRTIESLYQDAISAQSKFSAAKDKLNSTELSYTLVKEQFSLGMRNTVELTTEQNNYANALQDMLQAKYSALLSLKLLQFYQGTEISL